MKKRIFITRDILSDGPKLLQEAGFTVDINPNNSPIHYDELIKLTKNYDALITMLTDRIDENFLKKNSHLKVIANYAVGFNNIDIKTAALLNIPVTNTPDVLTEATAEIALGLMIAASRNFNDAHKSVEDGRWVSWQPRGHLGHALKEKTLGIIGAGRIGLRLAEMASLAFKMKIIYVSPTEKKTNFKAQKVELDELLLQSDFISLHAPLKSETRNLIGEKELKKMKSSAVLINTSRGEIIDQEALINALKENIIFSAGLDVTDPEPLPLNSELLKLPNVFILPHIGSASFEARREMSLLCAKNIMAGLEGRKLISQIN